METKSEALFERAQKVIPGGVNSPASGISLRWPASSVH